MDSIAASKDKQRQIVGWILLVGLLLLRLPFYAGITSFIFYQSIGQAIWIRGIFEIGTHLLTACLIWWERERLADFNIDTLALSIIILFKPIQTILEAIQDPNRGTQYASLDPFAFPYVLSWIFWAISFGLILALWRSHAHLPKLSSVSLGWFGVGMLVGVLAILITAYPESFAIHKIQLYTTGKPTVALFAQTPMDFFYQLGYAAVTEEPVFRAFLWGYLLKARWRTVWIWLFQAVLFMLGHIYYINTYPLSFWLGVPVFALVVGLLVWRTKTISSSLAAHAITNAMSRPIWYMVAWYRMM